MGISAVQQNRVRVFLFTYILLCLYNVMIRSSAAATSDQDAHLVRRNRIGTIYVHIIIIITIILCSKVVDLKGKTERL